jgi:DUF1680 family protein
MALEELPAIAYGICEEAGISINLYGESRATLDLETVGEVVVEQHTHYPFDGDVRIVITPRQAAEFRVRVRIPGWARQSSIRVNGTPWSGSSPPGTFVSLERIWRPGDEISLHFPMQPEVHRQSSNSMQESRGPEGEAIAQEVMRQDYIAFTRGPLVYATGLIDGYKNQETILLPEGGIESAITLRDAPDGHDGPALVFSPGTREPLTFLPYYEAGGRIDGAWRLTWLNVAGRALPSTSALPRGKP